jgi:acetoin utilization protein AcuB
MTHVPSVVRPDDSLAMAERMMRTYHIRHLPVVRDGALVGLLSEGDLTSAAARDAEPKPRVEAVMNRTPYAVDVATPLKEVLATMADRKLGSALVTERGELVGVLTTVDALRVLIDLLP